MTRLPASCPFSRDVKPDNILLDEQGERGGRRWEAEGADAGEPGPEGAALSPDTVSSPLPGHAHLTDFNIATIIKDGERATALAGTKPYMGECGPRPA